MKSTYFVENSQEIKVKQAKVNHNAITDFRRNFKKIKDSFSRIKLFTKSCRTGLVFVCVICNGYLYKKSIKMFDQAKYNSALDDLVF